MFTTSFIDRTLGLQGRCEVIQMSVQYSAVFHEGVADLRHETQVEGELMTLRCEIGELYRDV